MIQLRNELDRLSVAELENKIANLQTAVNLLTEQAARLQAENADLDLEVGELVNEVSALKMQRDEMEADNAALTAEVEALRAVAVASCNWRHDDWGDKWATDCEQAFIVTEGTPKDNGMAYCPYCGKRLVEVMPAEDEDTTP